MEMDTVDYKACFEQTPALMLALDINFTIVAVSDSYLKSTNTLRKSIIGQNIFDVFPDHPDDISVDEGSNILASLNRVLKNKTSDTITITKYDASKIESDDEGFLPTYQHRVHSPILDEFNNVKYIIQRVEEVAENEIWRAQLEDEKRLLKQVSDSEKRYSMLLMKSPFAFAVFKGKEMVITVANDSMKKIWQKDGQIEGKPLFEVLPELKDTPFPGLLDEVYATGIPFRGDDVLTQFQRGDKLEDSYYNFIYQPYLEADETISGVSAIVWEVTAQVLVKKALAQQAEAEKKALKSIEEINKRYYTMLMESPFAVSVVKGEDMVVTLANDLMKKFWGKGNDIEGKTLLQILPELKDQVFPDMIISVLSNGAPVYANEILAKLKHNDKMEDRYFNIVYQPYHETDGNISGVTTIAYEVTEMVLVRKKIEESEQRFRNLVEKCPSPVCILKGEDMILEVANDQVFKIWNVDKEALGKPFLDIIPEMKDQPFMEWVLNVYHTGITHYGNEEPVYFVKKSGEPEILYFNFVCQPYREDDGSITGVMVLASDVTEQVISRKKIEESEHRYHEMIFSSPSMIAILKGEEMIVDIANDAILETWGKGKDIFGKSLLTVMPEIVEQGFGDLFHQVYTTGQPNYGYEVPVYVMRNGKRELSYYTFVYQAQRDINNEMVGVAIIANEVTHKAELNQKIKNSEEQFRRLVMQAPVAICVLRGEDYLVETINEPMVQMWGRTMEEAINKPAFDVLVEFRDQGLKELLDQVYSTGQNIVVDELPLNIKRNGALENIFVKFVYEPLRETDGTITGVMALAHEITDQVMARKRTEESEKLFKQLLDTMPQIAWTNTVDGEITFYNHRWYDYTGLNHKQTKALGCKTIIHPDDLQNALEQYQSIRETNGGEFQIRGKRKDGTYRWHLIRLMPIKNEEGKIQLWMGTATDIQELRMLQQQKDDFISIASHELKTPITSLKASLQLLDRMKENTSPLMLSKLIAQANRSMEKVSVLTDDLLNANKANEGQLHINKKLVNLFELIDECCSYIRTEGIFTIKTEGNINVEVYADATRIGQVIINFVNNAVKYAPESKEIRVNIEKVNNMAKVSVIDKGQGISPEKLQYLFDRYYRVDSSGSQYSGLGLGLYISSEIIKKHNGQIGVDSELGKGSSFWFLLPIF